MRRKDAFPTVGPADANHHLLASEVANSRPHQVVQEAQAHGGEAAICRRLNRKGLDEQRVAHEGHILLLRVGQRTEFVRHAAEKYLLRVKRQQLVRRKVVYAVLKQHLAEPAVRALTAEAVDARDHRRKQPQHLVALARASAVVVQHLPALESQRVCVVRHQLLQPLGVGVPQARPGLVHEELLSVQQDVGRQQLRKVFRCIQVVHMVRQQFGQLRLRGRVVRLHRLHHQLHCIPCVAQRRRLTGPQQLVWERRLALQLAHKAAVMNVHVHLAAIAHQLALNGH